MGTNRLEAFSDGVMAIAITLLVIELHVPQGAGGHLADELIAQWPSYTAYITTFLTIGIMWVNHHVIITTVRRVDHTLLFVNLLLLFGIATLPFTTAVASAYLRDQEGAPTAMVVYAMWMALIAATFVMLLLHLGRHLELLAPQVTETQNRNARNRGLAGVGVYLAAAALALLSPLAAPVLCLAMPIYYIVAGRRLSQSAFENAD